jgi:hypothetical protein
MVAQSPVFFAVSEIVTQEFVLAVDGQETDTI